MFFDNLRSHAGRAGINYTFLTQKERDNETGLDYFLACYYSSTQGRFTGVDPQNIVFEKEQGRNADERARILQNYLVQPQNWNRYAYTRNNPETYTDPNGRCSSPSGFSNVNVGICIEAFIASPHIGGIGRGDNRDFAANDPSKTFRVQVQGIITRSDFAWNANLHATAGRSDVLIEGLGLKGTVTLNGTKDVDKQGNLHLHLQITGKNGFSGAPGAPEGEIKININLTVTSDGKVGIDKGSESTNYPSIGVYSYNQGQDGKPASNVIIELGETKPSALTQPLVPIPEVKPSRCPESPGCKQE